jgi:prepilin-type N-terminal cleavage/methylation domain-containing protein
VPGEKNRRAGFTLVELIVVIVILGILAAIAIPALTGYISKAEDKEWEMRARDANIAVHAVLDEAWANDEFNNGSAADAFTRGTVFNTLNCKLFPIGTLSYYAYGDSSETCRRAAALLGEEYSWPPTEVGYWTIALSAIKASDATAATADGFWFQAFPEGDTSGKPAVYVTYKLTRSEATSRSGFSNDLFNNGIVVYDPNAGYEVYHLTLD